MGNNHMFILIFYYLELMKWMISGRKPNTYKIVFFFFVRFRDSHMIKLVTFKKRIAINERINIKF
jgi:hypothetical protein